MRYAKTLGVAFATLFMVNGCSFFGLFSSDKTPVAYGKADKTPYPIDTCVDELSTNSEINESMLVDKIVANKKERMLYAYRNGKLLFKSRMSLGKNADEGDKLSMGDYRTPEGNYTIVRKKCDPRLYRSLMISYPNQKDIEESHAHGTEPGGYITIHGQPKWNADGHGDAYTLAHDWTEGCMAVPNKVIDKF